MGKAKVAIGATTSHTVSVWKDRVDDKGRTVSELYGYTRTAGVGQAFRTRDGATYVVTAGGALKRVDGRKTTKRERKVAREAAREAARVAARAAAHEANVPAGDNSVPVVDNVVTP